MRATIAFDLDEPHDREMHNVCVNADKYLFSLWNLDGWLRAQLKYDDLTDDVYDTYDLVRKQLYHFMDANGVSLDDLS